jgi:hypothetical protein
MAHALEMQDDFWDPSSRFALAVREITSVSATFILSADPGLSDFAWDDEDEEENSEHSSGSASGSRKRVDDASEPSTRVVPDALAKGLSVLVNGAPWQRVLMRIDDAADEAIIIIYGLMPGRQYDIELGVTPGDEPVRGQVTTSTDRNMRECRYYVQLLLCHPLSLPYVISFECGFSNV